MTETPLVQRLAEGLIRVSCRGLPADQRSERCQEWSAELPAILHDETVRPRFMRSVRALSYSAGIAATTRRLSRAAGWSRRAPASAWRDGAAPPQPDNLGLRATIGVAIWLVIIFASVSLLRAFPDPRGWPVVLGLGLAVAFVVFCIADIVRAPAVRYLPKWAWALICVIQVPGGGIIYLSVGRVGRSHSLPPGSAQSP
jgi:hypothetical protein